MPNQRYILAAFTISVIFPLLHVASCTNESKYSSTYCIKEAAHVKIPLSVWNICGPFTAKGLATTDSIITDPFSFCNCIRRHASDSLWLNGIYRPLYVQPDISEAFAIDVSDTTKRQTLIGHYLYMYCKINVPKSMCVYANVSTGMECSHFLNGKQLYRTDIQGLNIYPLHLTKGVNNYVVRAKITNNDMTFDTTLYDSISIAKLYAEWQSCNIIYPQIDSISHLSILTNAHQNVLHTPVRLRFTDVNGNEICQPIELENGTFAYYIPGMQNNVSYMCEMSICGTTVRQPVLCGKDDDAYSRFVHLRKKLASNHPRITEIDELMYRYQFLLSHPSRYEGDWWWQFKITPLSYQLECIMSHIEETYGDNDSEFNLQFIAYKSAQDNTIQRYLLMHPNKIKGKKKMPLIVVVRPAVEKRYHFFTCPQLARQWALNQLQALSDRYGYIVMMPEMRTYQHELLSPIAKKEILLAIKDVCQHYDIDTTCIYLHANCSGGYRALQMATDYPKMFKAIALYAPTYMPSTDSKYLQAQTPALHIENIKDVPIYIQGDPLDTHSPYITYKELIMECHKYNIPLTFLLKRNSGRLYNVTLVGEEACDFFHTLSN